MSSQKSRFCRLIKQLFRIQEFIIKIQAQMQKYNSKIKSNDQILNHSQNTKETKRNIYSNKNHEIHKKKDRIIQTTRKISQFSFSQATPVKCNFPHHRFPGTPKSAHKVAKNRAGVRNLDSFEILAGIQKPREGMPRI